MRGEFERVMAGRLPDNWHEAVAALKQEIADTKPKMATRQSSQKALEALVPATPELIGGSADLTGSNLTFVKGMGTVERRQLRRPLHPLRRARARHVRGRQRHGAARRTDPLRPATFFVFTDYMRPAIRIGAITRAHVIHVLTHDSIGLGEDGPTHQPIEHLASLRAMPHLHVYRPADAMEVAECWELAIRRNDGPSLLVLTRQALPTMRTDTAENRCARGGYVLAEAEGSARRDADRHRLRGVDRHGRPRRPGRRRASPPPWFHCRAGSCSPSRTKRIVLQVLGTAPRIGIEAAGGVRLGALARQ